MIYFGGVTILENRITGCHDTHAFSHSPNMIMVFKHCFLPLEFQRNNSESIRNCSVDAR